MRLLIALLAACVFFMFCPLLPLLLRWVTGGSSKYTPGNDPAMVMPALLFFTVPGGIVAIATVLIWYAKFR